LSGECLVCGGGYVRSRMPGLLACGSCGFVTADVQVSPEELRHLYSEQYFTGGEYKDYVSERALHEKHFRRRLALLKRYTAVPEEKFVFEIGCAYGFFLALAREHFGRVEGIDISADAVRYASETLGLRAYARDFLQHDLRERPDVVCLWDTIEHLERPDLYLEKLSCLMAPGSLIALTTGDIGSVMARLRGARWRQIHPPTHLHYFSKRTLARLLGKYGFDVVYSGYEGTYRSLDTAAYIIFNIKRQQPGIYRLLKKTGLLRISFYLNLYDIVHMIARRRWRAAGTG
jgi:2-polyprenyl-3-methyl-5-hydroxy-6-metoxy-1,4-benzoquinol methylase